MAHYTLRRASVALAFPVMRVHLAGFALLRTVDMCGLCGAFTALFLFREGARLCIVPIFAPACRQAGHLSQDRYGREAVLPGPPVAHPGHEVRCQ